MEYYFLGERELYLGFRLVGVDGCPVTNRNDALETFKLMTGQSSHVGGLVANDRPKVLILTEDVASMLEKEVLDWQKGGKAPLIVEVPGLQGRIQGRKTLSDSIREAVGIKI